jgi:hypothetical protein
MALSLSLEPGPTSALDLSRPHLCWAIPEGGGGEPSTVRTALHESAKLAAKHSTFPDRKPAPTCLAARLCHIALAQSNANIYMIHVT